MPSYPCVNVANHEMISSDFFVFKDLKDIN